MAARCVGCGRFTASGWLSDDGVCQDCWEAQPAELDQFTWCPACDAGNYPSGQLGSRLHYRCRSCGMDYSKEAA